MSERNLVSRPRGPELLGKADVITDTGFVRPIDAQTVAQLERPAVITLMCEPWELGPTDVDLPARQDAGVPVIGTDETDPRADSGVRRSASRPAFAGGGIEVMDSTYVGIGGVTMAESSCEKLRSLGAAVTQIDPRQSPPDFPVADVDALVVVEHRTRQELIGPNGFGSFTELEEKKPPASESSISVETST